MRSFYVSSSRKRSSCSSRDSEHLGSSPWSHCHAAVAASNSNRGTCRVLHRRWLPPCQQCPQAAVPACSSTSPPHEKPPKGQGLMAMVEQVAGEQLDWVEQQEKTS